MPSPRSHALIAATMAGIFAPALVLGSPITASAAGLTERFFPGACYARAYTRAHLLDHPNQRVTQIWFAPGPASGGHTQRLPLRFGFTLRDGRNYSALAYCQANNRCAIEGDGGRITFADRGENLRMSVDDYLIVEGATDFSPDLAQSDDRVFLLYPSHRSACR